MSPTGPVSPFSRAIRARAVSLPIMAIVSRTSVPGRSPQHQHLDDDDEEDYDEDMPARMPNGPPALFNRPPHPPPPPRELFANQLYRNNEMGPQSPIGQANFEEETVPNFQASSSQIIYKHPMHPENSGPVSMIHPILSRLPRK